MSEDMKIKREEEQRKWLEAEKAVCKDFREGKCTHQADHGGKRHICHYCWYKQDNPAAAHAPSACPWGKKR